MADLLDKIKELVGSEEVAKQVQSALGEFMIPKTEYAKQRDKSKELETLLEQSKLATMNEQEKFQHETAKLQATQKELASKLNRVDAERVFIQAGLSAEDYGMLLEQTVSDDKDKTLALANGFVSVLTKQKDFVANKTKEDLMNKVVTPPNPEPQVKTPPTTPKTVF